MRKIKSSMQEQLLKKNHPCLKTKLIKNVMPDCITDAF